MTIFKNFWRKLAESKQYREEFAAAHAKRSIPFQIRVLLKQRGWKQEKLASEASLTQGVISRAMNPNYGNLTLNTIVRIAAGFDVAFVGKFVPFSELGKWITEYTEESFQVLSFEIENAIAASTGMGFVQRGYSNEQLGKYISKQAKGGLKKPSASEIAERGTGQPTLTAQAFLVGDEQRGAQQSLAMAQGR